MVDPPVQDNASSNKRNREELNNTNSTDYFISSMTFAAPGGAFARGGGCDCDECGGSAFIPQAIVEAIRKHKQRKHERMPMKRAQVRDLVRRHGSISVYQMTLPLHSDPLVEFGQSHRVVFIKHLSKDCLLKTIGKGIVGSQDEERGRKVLEDWKQNDVFLVPSNGGKAVAWLHEPKAEQKQERSSNSNSSKEEIGKDDNQTAEVQNGKSENPTTSSSNGHAIMYVCKIPQESVEKKSEEGETNSNSNSNNGDNEDSSSEWYENVQKTCKYALKMMNEMDTDENNGTITWKDKDGIRYFKLPEEMAAQIRETLTNL